MKNYCERIFNAIEALKGKECKHKRIITTVSEIMNVCAKYKLSVNQIERVLGYKLIR